MRWQRKFNILLHVLAWVAFLFLPILFIRTGKITAHDLISSWELWFFASCFITLYYLSSYVWTPYVIRHRRYILYIFSLILIGILFGYLLRPFDRLLKIKAPYPREFTDSENRPIPPTFHNHSIPLNRNSHMPPPRGDVSRLDIASVYLVALMVILGSLFRVLKYWLESQQKMQQVRLELTKSELAFFKAQLHPHFLFNTLNNIYSLALINDPSTATSIYKLSQLMRYYMDERNNQEVDLDDEICAIQDFISLQKLRVGSNCTLTERYEGGRSDKKIYPFILFPFIENAFKYGLRATEPCYLDFLIEVVDDGCLLKIRNSVSPELAEQSSFGIGLRNTKKLLENLYADRYELTIKEGKEEFFVKLLLYI